jgi:hypothetical protein
MWLLRLARQGGRRAALGFGIVFCCALAVAGQQAPTTAGGDVQSLAGAWRFALDEAAVGIEQSWWTRTLDGRVEMPVDLAAQGMGHAITLETPWVGQIIDRSYFTAPEYAPHREPGRIRVPFWLQPERRYMGAAWYQRDVEIPAAWKGQRVTLTLERPHWQTIVWLGRRAIGSNDSLSTPHVYDLGTDVQPGRHVITIRVDNRLIVDVGVNSHSISDHTQGNWHGIVGRVELAATAPVWIDDLQVYPRLADRSVRVRGRIGNATGQEGRGRVRLEAALTGSSDAGSPGPQHVEVSWSSEGGSFDAAYPLGPDARTWDEFDPALYRISATIDDDPASGRSVVFGLREIGVDGTQFTINGRRTFLRGTLESAIFPKTGHPPTDVDAWKRVIGIARAHGLNHIRFHSWCPPRAAFVAADELGFYFQVEAGSWANQSTRLGIGLPVDAWVDRETDRILREYGNHPSFVLMAYGNEPEGRHHEWLTAWLARVRAADPRRLYTGAAGWPEIEANEFHLLPDPRIHAWGAELKSRVNARPPETRTDYREFVAAKKVPVVSHEIGQWCAYPNFDEMPKYTGYLKPRNFEIFRERLQASGMLAQAREFLLASGKLQTLLYKEDIESALRTPGMAGFQLLDLHDFPGQGTALVGVLDAFWDSKGYVTADEFRRFSGVTVPLARLDRRVFTRRDTLTADIEVAHFGAAPLAGVTPAWRLVGDDGRSVAGGRLETRTIPVGNGTALGRVAVPLETVPAPRRYRLVVTIDGVDAENDWDVWVYPPRVETTARSAHVARDLDAQALAALASGRPVLLALDPARVANDARLPVKLGFSSIFWNTAWTGRQAPTTLGVLVDPAHPAFASFPTDAHSNWQWWYVVTRAAPMLLDGLPQALRPTVQVIDDWFTARKLGLAFEARVNGGRLFVTSIDLERDLDENIVARQFRASVLRYIESPRFAPTVELTPEQVRALVQEGSGKVSPER